jgi:hypothetical protein
MIATHWQPRCLSAFDRRPVALRPRLTTGLPFHFETRTVPRSIALLDCESSKSYATAVYNLSLFEDVLWIAALLNARNLIKL